MRPHLGRREEALQTAQQAAELYQQLARERPDAFRPDWATSLNNLANMLSELGRREEALPTAQQAVSIREQLARERPDVFLSALAKSVSVEGNCLRALDRLSEAAEAREKALRFLFPVFERRPLAHFPLMAAICRAYLEDAEAVNREPDPELLAPVIDIFQKCNQQSQPME